MITFERAYKTSDGHMVPDLKTAQVMELVTLLKLDGSKIAELIVENRVQVLDILTTSKDSRPRARAVNGGKRTRKPKSPAAPTPVPVMDEEDVAATRTPGALVEDED